MGPDGHPEHPQADRPTTGPIGPPAELGGLPAGDSGWQTRRRTGAVTTLP